MMIKRQNTNFSFQMTILVEKVQTNHQQLHKQEVSELVEPEVPLGNEIWPKSNSVGGAIKLVMNPLIVQLNYNLPIGVQGVLNPHIGKIIVGSIQKRFVNKQLTFL